MNADKMHSRRRLILAGNSHIVALVSDRHEPEPVLRLLNESDQLYALDGPWPRTETYWTRLVENAFGADIAIMWGGNEHNVTYFFQDAYAFDFLSNYVTKIVPSLEIVPRSRINKRFKKISIDDFSALLNALRKGQPSSISVLGTPPPKKDNDQLRQMIRREPYFVNWAAQIGVDIEDIKITAPHVRLKLWYVLQDLLKQTAQDAGAAFISVPAETQDEEGFLREEYWRDDVTHANSAYGEIMLAKVLKEFGIAG